ncbi:MAG: hypothetical protein ABL879_17630 [Devosia sp.]
MNLKRVAVLSALPLLAACAPEVESTIYVADIETAVTSDAAVSVPAVLRVPQQGEDECKAGLDALIERLKAIAPVTGKGQCISKDQDGSGTQLAEVETALQLIPAGGTVPDGNLFAIEVATTDAGAYDLTFKMLKPIGDVVKALQTGDSMQTEFTATRMIFTLNNDGADPVTVTGNHVFLDNKPAIIDLTDPVEIARRGEAVLRFSDVAATHVEQGNSYWFATISPAN